MSEPSVIALHSVDLGVLDPAAAAVFFTETWGLKTVSDDTDAVWLRGTGPFHHILALHRRPGTEILRVNLLAPDRTAVDALHGKVSAGASAHGLSEITAPAALGQPGGGYGFAFRDREGRNLAIVAEIETHADTADAADRPRKLAHVVLNADDPEGSVDLFTDLLGFRVSDRTRMHNFLRCGDAAAGPIDHHNIAIGNGGGAKLNHIAFEMPDLESVMRGAGRCRDAGWPIEWGVGRHGPGNNVFAYFVGVEDIPIEYTAEVEQVDESYPTGSPDDWGWPKGRSDHWGITDPPSDRLKTAQSRVGFAADSFAL
ncbi:MAG: VOC family protein [Alphaproteobacteria bacterium]|nr:VOC family protein [Alphaproteobacteria bacterium]